MGAGLDIALKCFFWKYIHHRFQEQCVNSKIVPSLVSPTFVNIAQNFLSVDMAQGLPVLIKWTFRILSQYHILHHPSTILEE